ncbi:hypothetical protein [Methylocystis sp. ATCC 49242]|uniref:hypothetical protein n=1 Tax=Methylocystis sp. ATCC 49242 TaxID=622637 RepID=UPI0001F87DF5|nr:hypothetical protein [Methylocystis sp. ATCC 49242]
MLVEALVTMLAAATPQKPPTAVIAPAALFSFASAPAYQPEKRAVDNWRFESALSLELSPLAAARRATGAEDNDPARCVKLNNYWCIKRAGWTGEIAADADGHVAFATAEEGAAVAALLLRRYYVDYKRRTARAIVERWAPAQCTPMIGHAVPGPPASRAGMARMLPQRVVPMGLAPRGIQNTLRARWLAAHGRGGVGGGVASRRGSSAALDLLPAPSIMEGVSEIRSRKRERVDPKTITPDVETPSAMATASLPPLPPIRSLGDCSGELARIANYAAYVAEGVVSGPNEDLMLFTAAGQPTGNLAKVMANMATVEIGPSRPRAGLIVAAVAQLRRMLENPATLQPAPPESPETTAPAAAEASTTPELPPAAAAR